MKTIEFFKRKGYNPAFATIGGEVLLDGICVGEWNGYLDNIRFEGGDDSEHYGSIRFNTLEECASWIVGCGRYDHDYDFHKGAMHYYFNTKTGYKHLEDYDKCFPLIEKFTITIETEA